MNDEQQAGTRIVACHDDAMDLDTHRLVTRLIVEPSLSSKVMNEEIFGPLLPLITYRNIDDIGSSIANQDLWLCMLDEL
ncbi:hypothetical protein OH492_12330 [Vibrio chagasii]|nr:hypothetical protein [Vibrio chagasii]